MIMMQREWRRWVRVADRRFRWFWRCAVMSLLLALWGSTGEDPWPRWMGWLIVAENAASLVAMMMMRRGMLRDFWATFALWVEECGGADGMAARGWDPEQAVHCLVGYINTRLGDQVYEFCEGKRTRVRSTTGGKDGRGADG
jgi:hypothetical protein